MLVDVFVVNANNILSVPKSCNYVLNYLFPIIAKVAGEEEEEVAEDYEEVVLVSTSRILISLAVWIVCPAAVEIRKGWTGRRYFAEDECLCLSLADFFVYHFLIPWSWLLLLFHTSINNKLWYMHHISICKWRNFAKMSSMCHLWNDEEEAVLLGWMVLQQMMDGSESNEFVMPPPPLLQNVKVDLVISMIGKSKRDLHLHDRYIRNGYCTFHLVTYHPPGHNCFHWIH